MLSKLKNKRGITLIALVITIIVLLILAGISIAQLTGNGLFEKAKLAKEESKNAQGDEEDKIKQYSNEINSYINGNRDNISYNYSLNEEVVGTWVDGKPLYQKSFIGKIPSNLSTTEWQQIVQVSNALDICVSLNTSIYYEGAGFYFANYSGSDFLHKIDTAGYLCFTASNANFRNKQYYSTVQYTKTTDAATNN